MLAYIKGTLEMKMTGYIVIDVGGLGYKVFMSESGIEKLGNIGETVKVHTFYKVREDDNNYFVDITLRNTSGQIAFFNQLQFLNSKMSPIRPSFYTDNFFSLMPGEKKTVTIETAKGKLKDGAVLALKGWNINKQEYKLK